MKILFYCVRMCLYVCCRILLCECMCASVCVFLHQFDWRNEYANDVNNPLFFRTNQFGFSVSLQPSINQQQCTTSVKLAFNSLTVNQT